MPTENTFWKLASNYEIHIPKLQRDYAQGREEPGIDQIRKALIDEIFKALSTDDYTLTLNFIYGALTEEENGTTLFIPIDGQQRLTTLFLLHWYIFSRSKYSEGLTRLSKGFSYSTRDTSKRFCENIVKYGDRLDFSIEKAQDTKLSEQIKDGFWFAGSFACDPTVQSMWRVIDDIHSKFITTDVAPMLCKLTSDNCPISFLWLQMDGFKDTNDLYIKMNARGKALTDFEIFKAKLQTSPLLSNVLEHDDNTERIHFISKFNNQYAELFYSFEPNHYDVSMFAFFSTLIRDEFCRYACEVGVAQRDYREDYKKFEKMNGSMLYRFLEEGRFDSREYDKCTDSELVLADTIKKADHLFDILCANKESINNNNSNHKLSKYHPDDKDIYFVDYSKSKDRETIIRHAMFEYLNRFGYPDSDEKKASYNLWKRFIYNVITNTDVAAHTEYMCQTMVVINHLINRISEETSNGLLQMIIDYDSYSEINNFDVGIKYQVDEEIIKARLMLKNNLWKQSILEAEEFFEDGQIIFLLNYALLNDDYNLELFSNGFSIAKKIFGAKKKLVCNTVLFEKALLCMNDPTTNNTGHLLKQSNAKSSWGFCRSEYRNLLSNKTEIVKSKKQSIIVSLMKTLNTKEEISDQLERIIANYGGMTLIGKDAWKKAFIDYDLFGKKIADNAEVYFSNCIHLGKNNTEVLLLGGTTVRSYSMELNTLILYYDLIKNGAASNSIRRFAQTTGDITRDSTFPIRYLEYKSHKIGFVNDKNPYFLIVDKEDNELRKSRDEVLDYLLSL